MHRRPLGRTGFSVAPLAFGGNVFGWTIDEKTSFGLLDAFAGAGFNLVDTADSYSRWARGNQGGESETIIGRWIAHRGHHNDILIATKVGSDMGAGRNLRRDYIMQSAEASLARLQVDAIDLYQSHWDDPQTPLDESLEAYARLIEQGKVRAIGASNYDAARLGEALQVSRQHKLPRYETLQPQYNLYDRDTFEGPLAEVCSKQQLGVITYFSLAAGFLTGKYRSSDDFGKSPRGRGMKKYLNPRGQAILAALDEVAQHHDARPAQIALAWLIAQPDITAPIASATSLAQLDELLAATRLSLDNDSLALLNDASSTAENT